MNFIYCFITKLDVTYKKFIIISIVKPAICINVSNLFCFEMTLYMFRTVFSSIIRSSRLYSTLCIFIITLNSAELKTPVSTHRHSYKNWENGIEFCSTDYLKFCYRILRFNVHRPVHLNIISIVKPTIFINVPNLFYFEMTLYMFRTVFSSIIRSSRLYIQQQAFVKQILLSAC